MCKPEAGVQRAILDLLAAEHIFAHPDQHGRVPQRPSGPPFQGRATSKPEGIVGLAIVRQCPMVTTRVAELLDVLGSAVELVTEAVLLTCPRDPLTSSLILNALLVPTGMLPKLQVSISPLLVQPPVSDL